eukprot:Rhum_TRINITY_DN18706_c0_g1::Rhum_TRINITY_DN18706_c0_g1_i1::g.168182::m.168182/K03283/HSPA1s; heat shock 70kDa protein 1/2/6/8
MPPGGKDREAIRDAGAAGAASEPGRACLGIDIGRATCTVAAWEDGEVKTLHGFTHTDPMVPCLVSREDPDLAGHAAAKQWRHHPGEMLSNPLCYFYGETTRESAPGHAQALGDTEGSISRAIKSLLSTLLRVAVTEYRLGESLKDCRVVVTLPSALNPAQAEVYAVCVKEFADAEGLASINTVPSHEAAILASHLRSERKITKLWMSERIMVIDVGHGLSCAVCAMRHGGEAELLHASDDSTLGGDAMDRLLFAKFEAELRKKNPDAETPLPHAAAVNLLQSCRQLKEAFVGGATKQTIEMSGFCGVKDFAISISKAMMEVSLGSVFKAMSAFVQAALAKAGGRVALSEVILIGGASKMPRVQSDIRKIFGAPEPAPAARDGRREHLAPAGAPPAPRSKSPLLVKKGLLKKKEGAAAAPSVPVDNGPPVNVLTPLTPDEHGADGAALACWHGRKKGAAEAAVAAVSGSSTTLSASADVGSSSRSVSPSLHIGGAGASGSALSFLGAGVPSTTGVAVAGDRMCPILRKFTPLAADGTLTKGVVLHIKNQAKVQIDVLQGERRKASDNTLLSSFFVYLADAAKLSKQGGSPVSFKSLCVEFTYSSDTLVVDAWVQGASHISVKNQITKELYTILEPNNKAWAETKFTPALPTSGFSLKEGFIRFDQEADAEEMEEAAEREKQRDQKRADMLVFERHRTKLDTEQRKARERVAAQERSARREIDEDFLFY